MEQKTLVKLGDGFIIISDEHVKECDLFLQSNAEGNNYIVEASYIKEEMGEKGKIISSSFDITLFDKLHELPKIDFSELSEKDCKKIGYIDTERLAEDIYREFPCNPKDKPEWHFNRDVHCFKKRKAYVNGCKKILEFTSDKLFTLDDIRVAIDGESSGARLLEILSRPKSWSVEVVEEESSNVIKIVKIN
jgi:hypothetical protein